MEITSIIGQEKNKWLILLIFCKTIVLGLHLIIEITIQTKMFKRINSIGNFPIFKFLQLQATF